MATEYETVTANIIIYYFCYNKKLSDDVIKVIDFLANNAIKELDNLKLFDINALLYTSVITTKEYVNDLIVLSKKRPNNLHQNG